MSSSAPEIKREEEIDDSEITLPQNTDTDVVLDSVSIKVGSPDSGREQASAQNSRRRCSFFRCYEYMPVPLPVPIKWITCCFFIVCCAAVSYVFIAVVTATILPLLLIAWLVVRLFQFIVRGKSDQKRFLVMMILRYWTFMVLLLLLVVLGIFYPIAKNAAGLKLVMIFGLSITKWIKIICTLIGIFFICQYIWYVILVLLSPIILIDVHECEKSYTFVDSTSEIIGCILFLWAEAVVRDSLPTFKQSKIFEIYTEKWIKVSVYLLIGHNVIALSTRTLVWSLAIMFGDYLEVDGCINFTLSTFCCDMLTANYFNKKNVVYIAAGIKRSVNFVLNVVMLLLTWVLYFGNHLDTTIPRNKSILESGTWTFVSLLICSFLWMFKSCILLYWETHTVYSRLHSKISDTGKQLYFLMMLTYQHCGAVIEEDEDPMRVSVVNFDKKKEKWILGVQNLRYAILDRKIIRAEFIDNIGEKASIYEIQIAARRFLIAQTALLDQRTVGILSHFQGTDSTTRDEKCIEVLKKVVQVENLDFHEDWEMFLGLLPDIHTAEEITFEKVKTFMERAHSRCLFLLNTLLSAKEVVKCLNRVMSGIIIVVTFIIWLLLTGLATTKVLVLIASPVLAATFIFGDTAKNLFQGLIFVYFAHPFDVGDLCLIDEKMLEVKRIEVWSTIFSEVRNIGEQQQIIYPNSALALKNFINHKTNFDWNDRIEFLCSPDQRITESVILQIQAYLNDEDEKFVPKFHSVKILEIGDKAKIVVHMRHKLPTTRGWTHFECLKEKEKRSLEFNIYILNLMKRLEFGTETPVTADSVDQNEIEDD